MGMFDHLKQYVISNPDPHSEFGKNFFQPVADREIASAEAEIGCQFPSQLKLFYREIGCGFLSKSRTNPPIVNEAQVNRILDPQSIAEVMKGRYQGRVDEIKDGELPFFELGEGAFFLFRYKSNSPNKVYSFSGRVLAEDFAEFMNRLHDDPKFYRLKKRPST